MELSTGRLEGSSRIQERPFGKSDQERKRRTQRAVKEPAAETDDQAAAAEAEEIHSLDDIA